MGALTARDLASSTGLYGPAVQAWALAAESYGFVTKNGSGKLELAPRVGDLLLDRTHPEYLGGQIAYLALRSLDFGKFGGLFTHGSTHPMAHFQAIEEATHWDHYAFLNAIRRNKGLNLRLRKGCGFLDVGCGTGTLIKKLVHVYPKTNFVGIDPSRKAIGQAKKLLRGTSVRLDVMEAESMSFSNEFDIAYLGESLYSARNKQKTADNCFNALRKNGVIAVVEGLLPSSRIRADENKLIMGMQLDFVLQGHDFLTRKEIISILKKSGFVNIQLKALGGAVYLVTARKR
jgi:ubiquinone/menaquinone biosynthesis C-methylase UbiE